jgi:hypothetical protein
MQTGTSKPNEKDSEFDDMTPEQLEAYLKSYDDDEIEAEV